MTTALGFYSMPTHWLGADARDPLRRDPPDRRDVERVPDQPVVVDARARTSPTHMFAAVAHARARAVRRIHADRALGDARDARRGLHPHGAGEGPQAEDDRAQARAPQRDAADRDARRPLARLHRRRRDPDRDGLLLAGDRPRRLRGRARSATIRCSRARSSCSRSRSCSSTSSPTSSTSSSTRGSPSERPPPRAEARGACAGIPRRGSVLGGRSGSGPRRRSARSSSRS